MLRQALGGLGLRLATASRIGRCGHDRACDNSAGRQREGEHRRKNELLHGLRFPCSAEISDVVFISFSAAAERDFVAPPMCFKLRRMMKQLLFAFGGEPAHRPLM
jgi:hypothetical protein